MPLLVIIPAKASRYHRGPPIARIRFYRATSARAPSNLTKIGVKPDPEICISLAPRQSSDRIRHPAYGSSLTRYPTEPTRRPVGNNVARGRETGEGEGRVIRHLPFHYCFARDTAAWHAIARSISPLVFTSVRSMDAGHMRNRAPLRAHRSYVINAPL